MFVVYMYNYCRCIAHTGMNTKAKHSSVFRFDMGRGRPSWKRVFKARDRLQPCLIEIHENWCDCDGFQSLFSFVSSFFGKFRKEFYQRESPPVTNPILGIREGTYCGPRLQLDLELRLCASHWARNVSNTINILSQNQLWNNHIKTSNSKSSQGIQVFFSSIYFAAPHSQTFKHWPGLKICWLFFSQTLQSLPTREFRGEENLVSYEKCDFQTHRLCMQTYPFSTVLL